MHFIGLRGAPRKYIQILDNYYIHNTIRTLGSHFSILGIILFISILFERVIRVPSCVSKNKSSSIVYDRGVITSHTFIGIPAWVGVCSVKI